MRCFFHFINSLTIKTLWFLYLNCMKNQSYIWLAIATIALLAVTVFSVLSPVYPLIYVLWILGIALLLIAVFKVLQDRYKTKKKFKDWYEDHPKGEKKVKS